MCLSICWICRHEGIGANRCKPQKAGGRVNLAVIADDVVTGLLQQVTGEGNRATFEGQRKTGKIQTIPIEVGWVCDRNSYVQSHHFQCNGCGFNAAIKQHAKAMGIGLPLGSYTIHLQGTETALNGQVDLRNRLAILLQCSTKGAVGDPPQGRIKRRVHCRLCALRAG